MLHYFSSYLPISLLLSTGRSRHAPQVAMAVSVFIAIPQDSHYDLGIDGLGGVSEETATKGDKMHLNSLQERAHCKAL